MSKSEILAELPKLNPQERTEILDRLWHLEEQEALRVGPSPKEKALLDRELNDFKSTGDAGAPWKEVESRPR